MEQDKSGTLSNTTPPNRSFFSKTSPLHRFSAFLLKLIHLCLVQSLTKPNTLDST